jgi:hypothetical protein
MMEEMVIRVAGELYDATIWVPVVLFSTLQRERGTQQDLPRHEGLVSEILKAIVPSQVARGVSLSSGGCRKEPYVERQN